MSVEIFFSSISMVKLFARPSRSSNPILDSPLGDMT